MDLHAVVFLSLLFSARQMLHVAGQKNSKRVANWLYSFYFVGGYNIIAKQYS